MSGPNQDALDFSGLADGYTAADITQQPDVDETLAKHLQDMFEQAYNARLTWERDVELYRQYIKGEQLIYRNRDTGEVVRVSGDDATTLRSLLNILRPTARSLIGKLTRAMPTWAVVPASNDFEEVHGAQAANALLQYVRRKENIDLKYLQVNEFLPWAGNGFLQLKWDRHGGPIRAWCKTCNYLGDEQEVGQPCPQCQLQKQIEADDQAIRAQQARLNVQMPVFDALQQAAPGLVQDHSEIPVDLPEPGIRQVGDLPVEQEPPELVEIHAGEPRIDTVDPRDFYPDPAAEDILHCNWVFKRTAAHVSEVRAEFPEFAEQIQAEKNIYCDRTAQLRFNSIDAASNMQYMDDHVYVYEYHEKPTEQYPKGRVVFKVDGKIVRKLEASPYWMLKRFPFYHFGFDKNPGEFWFEPFISNAWHRQRELNQMETQIREHCELVLRPKVLNPMGSRISDTEISATSAQIIKYNASVKDPHILDFPPLPAQVFDRRDQLAADIRQLAAVTEQEAGIGQSDPNGRAMAIVEAESDQAVGPILLRNNSEFRALGQGILQVFRAYASEESRWTVAGPDGVQMFSFDDLVLEDGFDVQIELDDGMSRNPAVRLTQVADLAAVGGGALFIDPATGIFDAKKFMRHARLRLLDGGYDMEATERSQASRIPYLLEQGQQYQPQPEDDPMIFAEVLLAWLRGPGRRADQQLVMDVRMLWQYYAAWAATGMPPPMGMGGMDPMLAQIGVSPQMMAGGAPPAPGSDQSSPGGTPNNPGHLGTDLVGDAGAMVQNADQQGEQQARVTPQHEG